MPSCDARVELEDFSPYSPPYLPRIMLSSTSLSRIVCRKRLRNSAFCLLSKNTSSASEKPPLTSFETSSFPSNDHRNTSFPSSPSSGLRLLFSRSASDMASNSASKETGSIYDFTVKDARGNDVDLSTYKGKVLLIVNVASKCGLTNSNYTELGQLYEKYKNKGLEILAFPCNQFGEEEPGSNEEILQFACTRFKADFPIFDKVEVNGEKAAPVYKFLKSSKGGIFGDSIKWNFAKFLVDKDGQVIDRYAPTTTPLSIEKDITKLLGLA